MGVGVFGVPAFGQEDGGEGCGEAAREEEPGAVGGCQDAVDPERGGGLGDIFAADIVDHGSDGFALSAFEDRIDLFGSFFGVGVAHGDAVAGDEAVNAVEAAPNFDGIGVNEARNAGPEHAARVACPMASEFLRQVCPDVGANPIGGGFVEDGRHGGCVAAAITFDVVDAERLGAHVEETEDLGIFDFFGAQARFSGDVVGEHAVQDGHGFAEHDLNASERLGREAFEQDFVAQNARIHHFGASCRVVMEVCFGDENLRQLFENAFAVGGAASFANIECGAVDIGLEGVLGEEIAEFGVCGAGFAGDSAAGIGAVFDEFGRGFVAQSERPRKQILRFAPESQFVAENIGANAEIIARQFFVGLQGFALSDALFDVFDKEIAFGGRDIESVEAVENRVAIGIPLKEFPEEFFALARLIEFVFSEIEIGQNAPEFDIVGDDIGIDGAENELRGARGIACGRVRFGQINAALAGVDRFFEQLFEIRNDARGVAAGFAKMQIEEAGLNFELIGERRGVISDVIGERPARDIIFADLFGGFGNLAQHRALRTIALVSLIEAFEGFFGIVHAFGIDAGQAVPQFALNFAIFFFDDVKPDLFGEEVPIGAAFEVLIEFKAQIVAAGGFFACFSDADEGFFAASDAIQNPRALENDLNIFLFVAGGFALNGEDFEEFVPGFKFFEIRREEFEIGAV